MILANQCYKWRHLSLKRVSLILACEKFSRKNMRADGNEEQISLPPTPRLLYYQRHKYSFIWKRKNKCLCHYSEKPLPL